MCTFALFLCVSEKGYVSFFVRISKESPLKSPFFEAPTSKML